MEWLWNDSFPPKQAHWLSRHSSFIVALCRETSKEKTILYETWRSTQSTKPQDTACRCTLFFWVHAASWHLFAFLALMSWGQWFPGPNRISEGTLDTARASPEVGWHWVFLLCVSWWNLHSVVHELLMLWSAESPSLEVPGIDNGNIQEVEEHSDVPLFVLASVGVCHTLIYEVHSTHVLIVQLYRIWPLDVEHPLFFFAPSLGHIYWGLASAGRGHVDHWTI